MFESLGMRWWRGQVLTGILMLGVLGSNAEAQGPVLGFRNETRPDITLKGTLVVGGGIGAMFLVDRPIRRFLQTHRSSELDGFANIVRPFGDPIAYAGVAAGMLGTGLITDNDDITRAAGRVIFAGVVTLVVHQAIKTVTGRARPDESPSPYNFKPFRNSKAGFVSGHAALAFTFATVFSDEIDNTWASVGLYTFATGTAWSRLNDNRHWPSDVVGGALLGYIVGKMAGDRWEMFGIRPPPFLRDGN